MTIQTNRKRNFYLSITLALLGSFFVWKMQGIASPNNNQLAALGLGYLLLVLCAAGIVLDEQILTEFDSERKQIRQKTKNLFQSQVRYIPYTDVERIGVARVGRPSNATEFYFLTLVLKNGDHVGTGHWVMSRENAYQQAQDIATRVGCSVNEGRLPNSKMNLSNLAIALLTGFSVYAIYYRKSVGPWCPAMWFGSAPLVIVLATTWATFNFLKRVRR